MKIITAEQIQKILDAKNSVAGTKDYLKYEMEYSFKDQNGRWKHGGYGVPMVNHDCPVKNVRGVVYIMRDADHRYAMRDAVLELLGWK